MIYQLAGGRNIDTDRELTFEERNFVQKMLIRAYLKVSREEFQNLWRIPGNPVWRGPETLDHPRAAALICLDLENKLSHRAG